MSEIFEKYKTAGLIPFSFKLSTTPDGKKKTADMPAHASIKKYTKSLIDQRKSGHAIRTGTEINGKFLIALDIDNKPDDATYLNGLTKWKELLRNNYTIPERAAVDIDDKFNIEILNTDKEILFLDTPTQRTGNGGYHYLFLVSAEQLKAIGGGLTGLNIDKNVKKYSIDIKANNGCLFCEPSKYKKNYKWLKAPGDTPILDIPDWIYNILKENRPTIQAKQKPKLTENIIHIETEQTKIKPIVKEKTDDIIYNYVECINPDRYNNRADWLKILLIFKNNNLNFNYFLEKSRKSKYYENDDYIIKTWDSFRPSNAYPLGSLYSLAKNDNLTEFNKLCSETMRQTSTEKLFNLSSFNFIDINKKYLIDGTETDNIIYNNINEWITDTNIKSLNIKSQYGSGKTQLIKNILDTHKPARVLWVSYRQTLTDNIYDEFKNYNFKNYLDGVYNGARQIIQLESLEILKQFYYIDDTISGEPVNIIPSFDIVIIDEIESILNHFSAATFTGTKAKDTYNYLYDIITASKKLMTLDGDINQRALSYVSNFGQMINIKNNYNINERKFNFMQDENKYILQLYDDITEAKKENKKIAICSMSKAETIKYNELILTHFNNDIKILTINADSQDTDKKLLKNIQKEIIKYDVFIYSPTVEAGVNIDINGLFNKLYCIVCGNSTSPRAFLQMTARIRHLNDNNINILNTSLFINDKISFWSFEDAKNILKFNNELATERTIEKTKDNNFIEVNKITPYTQTIIYNKVEKLNNNPAYFIKLLCILCDKKGIKCTFEEDERARLKQDKTILYNAIIECPDITTDEKLNIQSRINKREASTKDKLKLSKNYFCKLLNIVKLDLNILESFYKKENEIKNFINLIDDTQIKPTTTGEYLKIKIVKKLINDLGYKNIYDTIEINENEFITNLTNITTNKNVKYNCFDKTARAAFSMTNTLTNININQEIKTTIEKDGKQIETVLNKKPLLGHINAILKRYCLKITCIQRRASKYGLTTNKDNFYLLEHLKNIDEIIFYKKLNKYNNIIDNDNNINFNTYNFIYNHLRGNSEPENEYTNDEFTDDDDIIIKLSELEKDI